MESQNNETDHTASCWFHVAGTTGRTTGRCCVLFDVYLGDGQSNAQAVRRPLGERRGLSTLAGKVVASYQGWFATPNDGGPLGWTHYQFRAKEPLPNKVCIDFWPDVAELAPYERCETKLLHADGSPACVFSARNSKTVNRHFVNGGPPTDRLCSARPQSEEARHAGGRQAGAHAPTRRAFTELTTS